MQSNKSWVLFINDWANGADITGYILNAGQRTFKNTAPSGFKALCTANLPTPTIADPSTAFDVKLWSGQTSVSTDITGYNFSPDFAWIKNRSSAESHFAFDTIRGAAQYLYPNLTNGENDGGSNTLTAFNSDGFTLYDPGGWGVNATGNNYVGWAWDAGSSTASNTDGDITSSVRANQTAGFSIVKWTSPTWSGSPQSVGHGLNAAPAFIITKGLENAGSWYCYHKDLDASNPQTKYILLNDTGAAGTLANSWGTSAPDSNVFGDRLLGWSEGQDVIATVFHLSKIIVRLVRTSATAVTMVNLYTPTLR